MSGEQARSDMPIFECELDDVCLDDSCFDVCDIRSFCEWLILLRAKAGRLPEKPLFSPMYFYFYFYP